MIQSCIGGLSVGSAAMAGIEFPHLFSMIVTSGLWSVITFTSPTKYKVVGMGYLQLI